MVVVARASILLRGTFSALASRRTFYMFYNHPPKELVKREYIPPEERIVDHNKQHVERLEKQHIADLIGITTKRGQPFMRCVVVFEYHNLSITEFYHLAGMLKKNNLVFSFCKNLSFKEILEMEKKHRRMAILASGSKFFVTSFDQTIDPVDVLKKCVKIVAIPPPSTLSSLHPLPYNKRFFLAGARLDYTVFDPFQLADIIQLPDTHDILHETLSLLQSPIKSLANHLTYHPNTLHSQLESLSKQNEK